MALYKYSNNLHLDQAAEFDNVYNPGVAAPNAGIYRCTHCGYEIGIAHGHELPPQNHHTHPQNLGAIKWQLLVFAQHKA